MRHMPSRLDKRELVGAEGVAHTALAPEGVVLVASEQWTAESVAGAIPRGARVRVVGAAGLRLKVEPADAQVRVKRPGGPGLTVGGKEGT
jgi:membrane-bound ClpP family serine protease